MRCIRAGVASLPAFVLLPDEPERGSVPVVYKMIRNELIVNFLYRRVWEYHVFNEYLMLGLIATTAWAIWVVPFDSDSVGDRLAIDITILLVAVAFKQNGASPSTPSHTRSRHRPVLRIDALLRAFC